MSKLFLDDCRSPTDVTSAWHKSQFEEFPSLYSWEIVRSYDEFVQFILKNGLPTVISFDHDLAWEHYPQGDLRMGVPIDYSKFKEKTGYDAAKWLAEHCLNHKLELPDWFVHSFNPEGAKNIRTYLLRFEEIRHQFGPSQDSLTSEPGSV